MLDHSNDNYKAEFIAQVIKRKRILRTGILKYEKDFGRHELPWRRIQCTAFDILIAEVLLKRTTASAVERVYLPFLQKYPTPESLHFATEDMIAESLSSIGLQRQRARSLKEISAHLVNIEKADVPKDLSRLLNIPGIGDYTARAILSFAFGIPAAILDSNVERIITRVYQNILPEKPSKRLLQMTVDILLPRRAHRMFNLGLLDFGAFVCRYRDPLHNICPLKRVCDYYHNNCRSNNRTFIPK